MGLVTNSKESLYGGVNQQAAEHRLPTQVEDSVNAFPTVNNGLLKRNPTHVLDLDDNIDYASNMWIYAYDRGLAGDSEEKYSIQITANGMEIVDVTTGKVFNKVNGGIVYSDTNAENYLYPFAGSNGYSAVTIKDTTFLLNKNIQPRMINRSYNGVGTTTVTKYFDTIGLNPTERVIIPESRRLERLGSNSAPYKIKAYHCTHAIAESVPVFGGNTRVGVGSIEYRFTMYDVKVSTTLINIDGYVISYTANAEYENVRLYDRENDYFTLRGTTTAYVDSLDTYETWITNLYTRLKEVLPSDEYFVDIVDGDNIKVVRYDGIAPTTSFSITFESKSWLTPSSNIIVDSTDVLESLESDYYSGIISSSTTEDIVDENVDYFKDGFVWVKASNPTTAYDYTIIMKDVNSTSYTCNVIGATTTEGAASSIASNINGGTVNFTAEAVGSVVRITAVNANMKSIETSDTYGNLASFGWTQAIGNYTELPKKLGYEGALVFIKGDIQSAFNGYWLIYENGLWSETVAPDTETLINPNTMPHTLVRNFDGSGNIVFNVSQWDEWSTKFVGDDDSNPSPTFVSGDSIKDIFFFKNRLGFITPRTVIMSEVGNYGNFFRTTVVTVLDSDRIDTTVDTTKAIELEYATYLEDSLMLFSDKAQFKIEGGAILSPKSIQASQTSAYEINKDVRPIFMNDKVFFCAKRGNYSAIMQYHIFGDGRISEAVDISSHIDKYIPQDVKTLSGSSINNMLFITVESAPDTIFVYKYLDSGEDRIQSAWFKWEYNGELYGAFTLGKNLNILIKRYQSSVVSDWVLGSGIWDGSELWTSQGIWVGNPDELTSSENFEIQPIHPIDHTEYFVDASNFVEDTNIIENLTSTALSSNLEYGCNVQMINASTIIIDNENIVTYTITVNTLKGGLYTSINESLVLPRDLSDFVTNIVITINDTFPIVFTGISFMYDINNPIELLYNGLFQNGEVDWTFTDWTINYGQKETGSIIPVKVDLGEWAFKANNQPLTRGTLKMKTCQINSENNSDFELEVRDIQRDSIRQVKSRYTVNRKPMVYGDSRNIRLAITNNSDKGFRINSVSLEGNYNSRSRRV